MSEFALKGLEARSARTARDDHKEAQSKDCSYRKLLLEFHLQL